MHRVRRHEQQVAGSVPATAASGTPSSRRSRRTPASRFQALVRWRECREGAGQRRGERQPARTDRHRRVRSRARRRTGPGRRRSCSAAIRASASRRCCCRPWPRSARRASALYVTGEESVEQIALRAQRLGLVNAAVELLAEVQLEAIVGAIRTQRPDVVVIDSIQTVYTEALESAPGSVAQVRECAAQLTRLAKQSGDHDHPGRTRDQGGRDRRSTRARTHRRHRSLLRRRYPLELPPGARDQEPLRRRQRTRCFRDDGARTERRRQSFGAVPVTTRQGGRREAACWRRSRARDRCSSRCRRSSTPCRERSPSGSPWASIRSGSRCCSPCCIATAGVEIAGLGRVRQRGGGCAHRRARSRFGRLDGDLFVI